MNTQENELIINYVLFLYVIDISADIFSKYLIKSLLSNSGLEGIGNYIQYLDYTVPESCKLLEQRDLYYYM